MESSPLLYAIKWEYFILENSSEHSCVRYFSILQRWLKYKLY